MLLGNNFIPVPEKQTNDIAINFIYAILIFSSFATQYIYFGS